jgi:hypothetical protein
MACKFQIFTPALQFYLTHEGVLHRSDDHSMAFTVLQRISQFCSQYRITKKSAKLARHSAKDYTRKGVPSNYQQNWYDNVLDRHLTIQRT